MPPLCRTKHNRAKPMFESASALFSIADAGEFRFARFYIVCEEVPLGTPESPLIVCGLSDTLLECPNVAVCLFWNFFVVWSSYNITYHPKARYAYCGSSILMRSTLHRYQEKVQKSGWCVWKHWQLLKAAIVHAMIGKCLTLRSEAKQEEQIMDTDMTGLSAQEVQERREHGEGGTGAKSITKSKAQIIRENVITLFNLLNFIIAGLLFAVGAYTNMLFLAVIFLNIAVGIAQELKAKKLVDELSILNRPGVCVRRGAKDIQIELDEVVKDD